MPEFLLLVLLASQLGSGRPTVEHTKDSLEKVHAAVSERRAVLVDVRSDEEWRRGHIAGAVHVPVDSLRKHSFDEGALAQALPDKAKPLYLYCMVGMRSKAAATILDRCGYDARPLKPGYEELLEAGFANEEGDTKPPLPAEGEDADQ